MLKTNYFLIEYSLLCSRIVICNKQLYHYRKRSDGLTNSLNDFKKSSYLLVNYNTTKVALETDNKSLFKSEVRSFIHVFENYKIDRLLESACSDIIFYCKLLFQIYNKAKQKMDIITYLRWMFFAHCHRNILNS